MRRPLPSFVCLLLVSAVHLQAQTAPAITAQPGSRTVNAGTPVTFSVTASGTTPSYQWLFGGNPISGATASTLTLSSPQPSDGGVYAVTVSNSAGTVTSNNASLLVYTPYLVHVLAGQVGVAGYGDGTGTGALFSHPGGLAADSSGNLYVADTLNSVIRKITPAGVVTTLAGQPGVTGAADGAGSAALFNFPSALAVDGAGNVYVADTFNSTIRKVTPSGTVTTLAGLAPSGANPVPMNQGSNNGTGAAARFNVPRGIAVDGTGTVWVADTGNSTIRKVTPAGVVTTFAGQAGNNNITDGTGGAARFAYPFGIASDAAGDLWVADTTSNTIRAITPGAVVTTLAGLGNNAGGAGGTGTVARFNQPTALAVDSRGNLYVADQGNDTVREVLPGGIVVTLAGIAGNVGNAEGSGTNARFNNPFGIAVGPSGQIFVADTENDTIRTGGTQPATDVPPVILTQPVSLTVTAGAAATFTVNASGTPTPTYQWQKNGSPLAGATAAAYTVAAAQAADTGSYSVLVTNQDGTVSSNTVTLSVLSKPAFAGGSQSQSVTAGGSVVLSANASGGNLAYQWYLNGTAVAGASGASLALSPAAAYQSGTYSVTATNSLGSASATIGTVTVTTDARLLNLSARAISAPGANVLTVGVSVTGGSKNLLFRGIGPGLAAFGVSDALLQTQLRLYDRNQVLLSADTGGWGGSAALAAIFSQVGAFALPAASLDSALAPPAVSPGLYTSQVQDTAGGTTGEALAEIYDADSGNPAGRLSNLSGRASVTATTNVTGGFVIGGSAAETVLLRGIGPALQGFGVPGPLSRPLLTLYHATGQGQVAVASASSWDSSLGPLFSRVGAFALPAGSADAALLVTLAPGAYTAVVSGVQGATGVALVEIYEVAGP